MKKVMIAVFTGSSSATPYDGYAHSHAAMMRGLVYDKEIAHDIRFINNDFTPSHGSGPGGRVRFGDGMAPPTVTFWVDSDREREAREAFTEKGFGHMLVTPGHEPVCFWRLTAEGALSVGKDDGATACVFYLAKGEIFSIDFFVGGASREMLPNVSTWAAGVYRRHPRPRDFYAGYIGSGSAESGYGPVMTLETAREALRK